MALETEGRSRRPDIVFALVVIAIGAVAVVEGMRMRPSQFDPLGPGAVPAMIGVALVGLAALVLLSAFSAFSIGDGQRLFTGMGDDATADSLHWRRSAGIFAITLAYVGALQLQLVDFRLATTAYMVAVMALLGRRDRRSLFIATALAVIVSVALDEVFRRVLSIDLP